MSRCGWCTLTRCKWNPITRNFEYTTQLGVVRSCGCACHRNEKIRFMKKEKRK